MFSQKDIYIIVTFIKTNPHSQFVEKIPSPPSKSYNLHSFLLKNVFSSFMQGEKT